MTLSSYAAACRELKEELIESLTSSEIEDLRKECAGAGWDAFVRWFLQSQQDIEEYIAAVPSRRASLKKWREYPNRPILVLGAIHHVDRAEILLQAVSSYDLQPGSSYRSMAVRAGRAYLEAFYLQDEDLWPFDDPDPFAS